MGISVHSTSSSSSSSRTRNIFKRMFSHMRPSPSSSSSSSSSTTLLPSQISLLEQCYSRDILAIVSPELLFRILPEDIKSRCSEEGVQEKTGRDKYPNHDSLIHKYFSSPTLYTSLGKIWTAERLYSKLLGLGIREGCVRRYWRETEDDRMRCEVGSEERWVQDVEGCEGVVREILGWARREMGEEEVEEERRVKRKEREVQRTVLEGEKRCWGVMLGWCK